MAGGTVGAGGPDSWARLQPMKHLTLLVLSIGLLAACSSAGDSGDGDIEGVWVLVSATVDGTDIPLVEGAEVTLTIEGDEVTGRAACNSYFGVIETDDGGVVIGQVGMTEMACEPPLMEVESAYLSAIGRVDSAEIEGETLVMTGAEVELRFERVASGG
jgi:heat shock protein HslJ